jgi:DNA-binding IclR family transcriptional regulator
MTENDARKLILSVLERGGGDGWTTERLSGRLGLSLGTVARVMVDLARAGFVSRVDDEWIPNLEFDY